MGCRGIRIWKTLESGIGGDTSTTFGFIDQQPAASIFRSHCQCSQRRFPVSADSAQSSSNVRHSLARPHACRSTSPEPSQKGRTCDVGHRVDGPAGRAGDSVGGLGPTGVAAVGIVAAAAAASVGRLSPPWDSTGIEDLDWLPGATSPGPRPFRDVCVGESPAKFWI